MEFQAEAVARSSFFLLPENVRQPYTVNGRQSGRESSRNEHCLLEPVTSSTSGKRREESGFPFLFPFFFCLFFLPDILEKQSPNVGPLTERNGRVKRVLG